MLSSEGVLVRVRTYGFPGCFTRPPGTSARNQPHGIDHVEACRPLGVVTLILVGVTLFPELLLLLEARDDDLRAHRAAMRVLSHVLT